MSLIMKFKKAKAIRSPRRCQTDSFSKWIWTAKSREACPSRLFPMTKWTLSSSCINRSKRRKKKLMIKSHNLSLPTWTGMTLEKSYCLRWKDISTEKECNDNSACWYQRTKKYSNKSSFIEEGPSGRRRKIPFCQIITICTTRSFAKGFSSQDITQSTCSHTKSITMETTQLWIRNAKIPKSVTASSWKQRSQWRSGSTTDSLTISLTLYTLQTIKLCSHSLTLDLNHLLALITRWRAQYSTTIQKRP